MADSNPTTKVCCKCKQVLPLESFYANRTAKDGRQGPCRTCIAQRHEQNREKLKQQSRAWYHANKERARAQNRLWREKNHEAKKAYNREWDKAHPELKRERDRRYAQKNADKIKTAKQKNYRARLITQPEKCLIARTVNRASHKAKLRHAPGVCSKEQWLAKIEYHGWRCLYCKSRLTLEAMHMEHRRPLIRGGSHWPANLAPACASCNLRKNWRTESEFRALRSNVLCAHNRVDAIAGSATTNGPT